MVQIVVSNIKHAVQKKLISFSFVMMMVNVSRSSGKSIFIYIGQRKSQRMTSLFEHG